RSAGFDWPRTLCGVGCPLSAVVRWWSTTLSTATGRRARRGEWPGRAGVRAAGAGAHANADPAERSLLGRPVRRLEAPADGAGAGGGAAHTAGRRHWGGQRVW